MLNDGVEEIESRAFDMLEKVTNITIPSSVTTVKSGILYCFTGTVYVPFKEGERPSGWSKDWFSGNNIVYKK